MADGGQQQAGNDQAAAPELTAAKQQIAELQKSLDSTRGELDNVRLDAALHKAISQREGWNPAMPAAHRVALIKAAIKAEPDGAGGFIVQVGGRPVADMQAAIDAITADAPILTAQAQQRRAARLEDIKTRADLEALAPEDRKALLKPATSGFSFSRGKK